MHIVHVLPWLVRGGTEGQVAELSQRLHVAGHRITIIAGADGPWRRALATHRIPAQIVPPYVHKGLHVRTGRISNLYTVGWLARQFRQLQPDVVSAYLYPAAPLAMIAARLAGVPVRLRNERDLGLMRGASPLPRWIERWSYRCTTRFVANSRAVADHLSWEEGIPREAVDVIHNGVMVPAVNSRARQGYDNAVTVIGMLANFLPESKDHLMLVRAAHRVIQQAPHVRFRLGGRPAPHRDRVQQAIRDLGLADYVQIETVTDPADFLTALDIGVLCSITEGFSNAVLEYMAHGKPVVGTRIPALIEAVREGETGFLVETRDDRALAEVLLTLIRDPDLRLRLGAAGRQRVLDQFTWEHALARWIALLTRLADKQA